MLQFFREYQRYIFIFITAIIVISFSFFGTYQTIEMAPPTDKVAFVAVNGQKVHASEVEAMAVFLGTDATFKRNTAGVWGSNFLNDGVLTKDFLITGLAEQLAAQYPDVLKGELESRLKREKRASFYTHPKAKFISAEGVWNYFAPDIKSGLEDLRQVEAPESPEGFKARVNLFLAEQQFPAALLNQILRYQEQQYPWLGADPNLQRLDLSLFGYHTIEDWFGQRFVRLAAQFIINSAIIAQQKGYDVSLHEALADLIHNAEVSYAELSSQVNLGITSPRQYMNEQLRRAGLDELSAAKIWQQVLLFRRLFDGVGTAIFVDPLMFQQYTDFALDTVEGQLYELPENLRLQDFRALQKLEAYLNAVGDKSTRKSLLDIPTAFLAVNEVQKTDPDLDQKRYLVELAETSKKALQARVGVKEMWSWQTDQAHWELLKKEFPELGIKKGTDSSERFAALESLDPTTRSRVDEFTRSAIVDQHPEWVTQALESAKKDNIVLNIRLNGGSFPIRGVTDRQAFVALLDSAPLGIGGNATPVQEKLNRYSADGQYFYSITVLDRSPNWEVLTFAEAASDDTLNKKVLAQLEPFYVKVRNSDPAKYRQGETGWKPLSEVQDLVAADYYKDLLNAIEKDYRTNLPKGQETVTIGTNGAAAYRFLSYVRQARERIMKNSNATSDLVASPHQQEQLGKLPPSQPLADQWKLNQRAYSLRHSDDSADKSRELLFTLKPDQWTDVNAQPNGDVWFFQLASRSPAPGGVIAGQAMSRAVAQLGGDGERLLMYEVLDVIRQKQAISLSYLDRVEVEGQRSAGGDVHEDTQGGE